MSRADKADELAGLHVLVVDDDQDSRDVMQAALHHAGALVTVVPSAKKALEALAGVIPHVIVCDLKMPECDGPSFVRELRRKPSLRSIPVLAVTAYDHLYVKHELHDAGFLGFLRKPLSFSDVVRAVAALARSGRSDGSPGGPGRAGSPDRG